MIKILIVDDSQAKRIKIEKSILDNHDIENNDILIVSCVKEARKILYEQHFDLMILDLVLPIEPEGECNSRNGVSFLNEIGINPSINAPIHILGLSGYKDEISSNYLEFSRKLWNLIEYDEFNSTWSDQLNNIIYHLVKTRKQFINATFTRQSDIILHTLDEKDMPNTVLGFDWGSIAENLSNIVLRSLNVKNYFSNGSKAKNIHKDTMIITSEYDFQNLIHLVLRPWIPGLEAENFVITFDGNTKNADFSIKGNSLIVEAKYIDSTGKKNDTMKTLEGLKDFYRKNGNVKALLFLILVDPKVSIDKHKVESEYSMVNSSPSIIVKIFINN